MADLRIRVVWGSGERPSKVVNVAVTSTPLVFTYSGSKTGQRPARAEGGFDVPQVDAGGASGRFIPQRATLDLQSLKRWLKAETRSVENGEETPANCWETDFDQLVELLDQLDPSREVIVA